MHTNNFEVKTTNKGAIQDFKYNEMLINLAPISSLDNSIMNVYVKGDNGYFGILDSEVPKRVSDDLVYTGSYDGINFHLQIDLHEGGVFTFDVRLNKSTEIIFATDICIANAGIRTKTTYASQYIDNRAYETENGFVVAMRKTTRDEKGFGFIQVGANKKVIEYVTEGYDFYKTFSRTEVYPKAINKLASRERNYEYAFIAEKVVDSNVTFYGYVKENQEYAIKGVEDVKIPEIQHRENNGEEITPFIHKYINGQEVSDSVLNETYDMKSIEYVNEKVGSFFTPSYAHVVTQTKELLTDRTHASIITSGNHKIDNSMQLVSTNYISGVFNAQLAVGNTGFNNLNKNISTGLYLNQFEGMRIFIKNEGQYQMLNVPSLYEMGFNYSKWIYVLPDNRIEIVAYTEVDAPNINFEINTLKEIEIIIIDNINDAFELGESEFKVANDTIQQEKYPNLKYKYVGLENRVTELDVQEDNIIQFQQKIADKFQFKILATTKKDYIETNVTFEDAVLNYERYIQKLTNGLKFEGENEKEAFEWNATVYWYLSNGLIHFATPHGVEQHGGAAWGTRDVCQGPIELFASIGKYDMVRDILIEIFKNQSYQTKNWPQWFMFDNYSNIRAGEAHGDIIVWPLKALGDYIAESGDRSILNVEIEYYDQENHCFTNEKYPISEHIQNEIKYIEDNFVPTTYLSQYADGDWDDTLQPYNSEDRKLMISGWTTSLTYQAIANIAPFIENQETRLKELAEKIKEDYYKYIIKDGVASGFVKFHDQNNIQYLLHPNDQITDIKYRLLPMNRGIISGLFEKEEIDTHYQLMQTKLKCPDGVRLMDNPAPYNGGVCSIFQRAESASTVGREISLQYVHAHIRYVEAMCKINKAQDAYEGLKIINPIMVNEILPTANLRQRNSYFSSSEGDYNNRYEYKENFHKLFTGDVNIKSGWRIYSSGPGIYLKQLIANFYGKKYLNGELVIDNTLSQSVVKVNLK